MSVIDILTRVDAICQKYDKYDVDKQRESNVSGDDAFARLYASVESDIESALQVRAFLSLVSLQLAVGSRLSDFGSGKFEINHVQKAELAANESNRASVVALNAEIRRVKARLLEEVPKLQRLAQKRVCFFHQFCFDVITLSLALL